MKRTLAVIVAIASWMLFGACYTALNYPYDGADIGTGGTASHSSSTAGSSCDGQHECPCLIDDDCRIFGTFCKPYVCSLDHICVPGAFAPATTMSCGELAGESHCDGMGMCVTCSDGMHSQGEDGADCGGVCSLQCDGALCSDIQKCKSGRCGIDGCLRSVDSTCQDDAECATLRCVMGKCATCEDPGDCASQQCAASQCKSPAGAPCNAHDDCANGNCNSTTKLCQSGYQELCLNPASCDSGYCFNSHCVLCAQNNQCLSGECIIPMGAPAGTCALPKDAYCTPTSAPCATGFTCMGSPSKCQ